MLHFPRCFHSSWEVQRAVFHLTACGALRRDPLGCQGHRAIPGTLKRKSPGCTSTRKAGRGSALPAPASCLLHFCLSPALPVKIRSTSILSLAYLSSPRTPGARQEQQRQAAHRRQLAAGSSPQAACSEAVTEQDFGLVVCGSLCRSKPFLVVAVAVLWPASSSGFPSEHFRFFRGEVKRRTDSEFSQACPCWHRPKAQSSLSRPRR